MPTTDRPRALDAPWQHEADAVLRALESDARAGISVDEARARLARWGANELEATPPEPWWQRLLAQFTSVLIILLLIATVVSAAVWVYERDEALPFEALTILFIVIANGILGYVQEARAERAVAALRAMTAAEASVIRDGERARVPARELVPGDIILVEEGDTIPADARLIATTALQVAEASLTGESLPVTKDTVPVDADAGVGDRTCLVFSGTTATYGRGAAVVTATGMRSEMGRIAGLLQETQVEQTPLQRELDRTGRLLGLIVLVIAAVIVVTIIVLEGIDDVSGIVDVLILGVALAVAAVPEGLPAVVTAVLAIGVQRMARRNVIVRKLPAVETLGSATVIASDKTGTLTKNEMTVRTAVTAGGRVDFSGSGYDPAGEALLDGAPLTSETVRLELERLLRAAERANNAALTRQDDRWLVQGDPTEGALLVAARKSGLAPDALERRFPRIDEVPFSSERKLMSTLNRDERHPETLRVFVKGAPDVLLARCTHELHGEHATPLTAERRAAILRANDDLANAALRALGVAFRTLPASDPANRAENVEHDLVFLGLLGLLDPPRAEARDAVALAQQAGVRPVMITGDHPGTAAAIARELGIARSDERVVVGSELERVDDDALVELAASTPVYARVNPEHKLRIVRALQRGGAVVAMTGDGVNDAPALRTADIGVAMGITGTDVSKEAADMVLTDDNFASIVAAVEEGRTIFANIQKFLRYLLSSNIGEVLTMFFGVVFAGALGLRDADPGADVVLPLLATQILWINLVTDGPPALALGADPVDHDVMRAQPRRQGSGVITRGMWGGIVFVGAIMAAGTLGVLDASLPGGLIEGDGTLDDARTLAFTTLMLFQLFNTFNARSDETSAFRLHYHNRWLWGALILSLSLHLLVIYVPFLRRAFDTVALSATDWLICALVASSVLWLREASKWVVRRVG